MSFELKSPIDSKVTFTSFWSENQAVTAGYEVILPDRLTTTYKKELPYLPHMQGRADIITEDISLLERFFLPMKRILSESL